MKVPNFFSVRVCFLVHLSSLALGSGLIDSSGIMAPDRSLKVAVIGFPYVLCGVLWVLPAFTVG